MLLLKAIIKIILAILFVISLILWLAANGSGHNISLETNFKFGITSSTIFILLLLVFYMGSNKVVK